MSLRPDHTAADLRALMDQFATAAQSATPAAQANRIRQQLQESRPDVMRHRGDTTIRVVKRAGNPIGEIGVDSEASSGNGPYYVKLYDGSYDAVGYDTAEEALAELKAAIKQGVAEGYKDYKAPYNRGRDDIDNEWDGEADRREEEYEKAQQERKAKEKKGVAEGVTESIDPVEQLRADILRFAR